LYLDKQYIDKISSSLELFSWKKADVAQSRCNVCGDSQKSRRKKRFNFFKTIDGNSFAVKCFNCSYSNLFSLYLKEYFPSEYKEYRREAFYEQSNTRQAVYKEEHVKKFDYRTSLKFKDVTKHKKISPLDVHCVYASDNEESLLYIQGRQIPANQHDRLWFSNNFKQSAMTINEKAAELLIEEPRLVIPFFNEEGSLIGMQGRDLSGKSSRKYITILQNEHCPKLYGLDRLDKTKDVYVVEGSIDSMFLDNSVAVCDLNLLRYNEDNAIYIFDNEYRSVDVLRQLSKAIAMKKKVVIFPKDIRCKDLNEMVLAGHVIIDIIKQNTFLGLKATMRLNSIKGI
jgi:hypothetical protein